MARAWRAQLNIYEMCVNLVEQGFESTAISSQREVAIFSAVQEALDASSTCDLEID
jgi:hypothetical protein